MVKESKEFWNKAEAIQMEEKPKAAEGATAAPPTTPMFFPVSCYSLHYRVFHQLEDLVWVDLRYCI